MSEENITQEFRSKSIDQKRNYLIEDINQNKLTSKKYKKVYRVFNYTEHLLILISPITGCVSISAFVSLVGIPIGIRDSVIGLKNFITEGIKE